MGGDEDGKVKGNKQSRYMIVKKVGKSVLRKEGVYRRASNRAPRMRRARWISFGMIVTRLPWMAQRLASSNKCTR